MNEATARIQGPASQDSGPAPTGHELKRILFVDDEPNLLESLSDAMRRYRQVWHVDFAGGGAAALEALAEEPADVVVADMQMPAMDGATLLAHVKDRYPTTIRVVLSGNMHPHVMARAATVAHRFLVKPCKAGDLALVIERSCKLRELTEQADAYRVTAAASTLPSRPGLYTQVANVIADPTSGPDQVAAVIERDITITARVLQLSNSAFFSTGRNITRLRDAVVYLGVDTIKSLTLTAEAFSKLAPRNIDGFSIEAFQRHAMLVARIAAAILPAGPAQHEAVTAALLHDIGKLVSVADDPRRWERLAAEARLRELPLHQIEQERESVTHAGTGAYLLSLWGLPDGVVEAVAHHHDPESLPGLALDPVAAVHIADALANEVQPGSALDPPPGRLDQELVERLGVAPWLDRWRRIAATAR